MLATAQNRVEPVPAPIASILTAEAGHQLQRIARLPIRSYPHKWHYHWACTITAVTFRGWCPDHIPPKAFMPSPRPGARDDAWPASTWVALDHHEGSDLVLSPEPVCIEVTGEQPLRIGLRAFGLWVGAINHDTYDLHRPTTCDISPTALLRNVLIVAK